MKRRVGAAGCAAASLVLAFPLGAQDRVAEMTRVLSDIRREGLEPSRVMTAFDQFVTVSGPRLTGSPAHKAAADWAKTTLASWGAEKLRVSDGGSR